MFAVVETGGKQYKVHPGQKIEVELLPLPPGSAHQFERVLLIATDDQTLVGQPLVEGASVLATVDRQGRGEKIIVFKYKSKKRYRRKTGHRQNYTYLTIDDVMVNGVSLAGDEARTTPHAEVVEDEEADLESPEEDEDETAEDEE